MVPNENWMASFPVGKMLILRFFAFNFWVRSVSSFSSVAAFGKGCLLTVRLLGFVFVRAVVPISFISLSARPVFCLLGCSTTSISSLSSEVAAFLLPFFRAAAEASSGSLALVLPFFIVLALGSDISSISLSCNASGEDFLGGLPPADLRATYGLLRGCPWDSLFFDFWIAGSVICLEGGLTEDDVALRGEGAGSISAGSSSRGRSSSWGGVRFCR